MFGIPIISTHGNFCHFEVMSVQSLLFQCSVVGQICGRALWFIAFITHGMGAAAAASFVAAAKVLTKVLSRRKKEVIKQKL